MKQLLIKDFPDSYDNLYEIYKLSKKEGTNEYLTSYKYGSFEMSVDTDESGDIGSIVITGNDYFFSEINSRAKVVMTHLNVLPYIVINDNYSLDDLYDFVLKLGENEETTNGDLECKYSDSQYEYDLIFMNNKLSMFIIEKKKH